MSANIFLFILRDIFIMDSNDFFTVKKSSKLYKFYNTIGKIPGYNILTPKKKYSNETNIFTNVCTFLRVNLFYLIATPILFIITGALLTLFVVYPFAGLISIFYTLPFMSPESIALGQQFLVLYCLTALIVIFVFWIAELTEFIENKRIKRYAMDDFDIKQPNIFVQAIKDKHNKICRSINVED